MTITPSTPLLLDTDVVSYLLKNDSRAEPYTQDLRGRLLAISFVTIGELYRWAFSHHWGPRRIQELDARLRNMVTLPYHDDVAIQWARITSNPGRVLPQNDAWIAACAITFRCTLVTHDRIFQGIPALQVIIH